MVSRWRLALALAALAVTGPRLVLAYLEADAVVVGDGLRFGLLAATGLATALVVTGGQVAIAVSALRATGPARRWLVAAWSATLACSAVLISPLVVLGLARSPLASVLTSSWARWAWAVASILIVEVVAAAVVAIPLLPSEGAESHEGQKPTPRFECERCGRNDFTSPQARAGHQRTCRDGEARGVDGQG